MMEIGAFGWVIVEACDLTSRLNCEKGRRGKWQTARETRNLQ
jgi:hypothetical protein